jgi:hypothetical protein
LNSADLAQGGSRIYFALLFLADMAKKFFGIEYSDFEDVWDTCLEMITIKEKANFEILQITDEKKKKQLRKVLNRLS